APQRRFDELDRLDDEDLAVGDHLARLQDPRDDAWVEDLLELVEPARIGEDDVRELPPIDLLVVTEHLGPEPLDDRAVSGGAAALLVAGDRIGVEHAGAHVAKHAGD